MSKLETMGKSALKYSALASSGVVLYSYAFTVVYYAGYLRGFGIDIQYVKFWPSLYDLMIRALAGIIAVALAISMYRLFFWVMDVTGKKLSTQKSRPLRWAGEALEGVNNIVVSIGCIVLVFISVYVIAEKSGVDHAKTSSVFPTLKDDTYNSGDTKAILIYQSDAVGIVKKYSAGQHKFLDGYEYVELTGRSFIIEKIR